MYASLWQITRYLRIEAERLNFSRCSDLKKRKEKLARKGASLFFTFSQSEQLLQKGIKKKYLE